MAEQKNVAASLTVATPDSYRWAFEMQGNRMVPGGFTPLMEEIVSQHDLTIAVVFRVVWRFCQMDRTQREGEPSPQILSEKINLAHSKFTLHLQKLVQAGLIIDQTPELKHKPDAYAISNSRQIVWKTSVRVWICL